jgi:hypothetical protein
MTHIPVNLAVEDELSEAVLRRLLADAKRGFTAGTVYGRNGYGYLRRTIAGWNRAAKGIPFIVLADLDNEECAPALLNKWLSAPKHPNLIFRVAVREVESWLLGDTIHFAKYIGCPPSKMPQEPDALRDPKRTLIDLAKRSRLANIRSRIVPRTGSTAGQGPDYNACLSEFVRGTWNISEACRRSLSLERTVKCLSQFTPDWPR